MRPCLFVALLGLAGCSLLPHPNETPVSPAAEIAAPAGLVLELLPAVYDSVGLRGGFVEEGDGFASVRVIPAVAPWIGSPEEPNLRCTVVGSGNPLLALLVGWVVGIPSPIAIGSGGSARLTLAVSTRVKGDGDGATIWTTLHATPEAFNGPANPGPSAHCVSTGRLERRIAEVVAAEVARERAT